MRALQVWLAGLPKANLGEMARQLYQALVEINQLRVPSQTRLQLLELLRPEVHYVCGHLERHYLNQPIVLDERPRKVAGLCQALQNHLATGYKLIVVRALARSEQDRRQLLTIALQRAVHSLGALLTRSRPALQPGRREPLARAAPALSARRAARRAGRRGARPAGAPRSGPEHRAVLPRHAAAGLRALQPAAPVRHRPAGQGTGGLEHAGGDPAGQRTIQPVRFLAAA
ncbi:molecular chaperone [Stutzerimonas degradans]|nr:molecular chaperone [Stutzerimonas degradans]